jgi:glycosyltransferase involved in cell wall biosynthesis
MSGRGRLGVVIGDHNATFITDLVNHLGSSYTISTFAVPEPRAPFFRERLRRRALRRTLQRFLEANDVVFFEWASEQFALATHLPKIGRSVVRMHRYELFDWAPHINWGWVDRIIVVSHAKRSEFEQRFPTESHKLVVIPECVSVNRFQPDCRREFTGEIGVLCHLIPRKRVYELILAFRTLAFRGFDVRLHIGGGEVEGNGDYYSALRRLVTKCDLSQRVVFHGPVSDPVAWFKGIDIFVSNSFSEGLQVALLEAMAAGCYCLAHDWAGVEDALPSSNIYLSDEELVEKLERHILASPEVRRSEQRALRTAAQRYDVAVVAEQVCQVIENARSAA